jgi:hypothetical protein
MAQGKDDSHNKYIFSIVAIVFVVEVVAFATLLINSGGAFQSIASGDSGTGYVVGQAARIETQAYQPACIDSDKGAYYRTAGYVTYNGGKFYDNCVGSTLNEKYCTYDYNGDLVLETINYWCKWGCEKGACY